MEHRAELTYDRGTIRHAARFYAIRSIRVDGFIAFLVGVALFGVLLVTGERSWFVGVFGTVLFVALLVGIALVVVPYRRSLSVYERMSSKRVEMTLDDDGVATRSELGEQRIAWQ